MKHIYQCRRTFVAISGLIGLTFLGYTKDIDVATSMAAIAIGLAGANSYEGSKKKEAGNEV